jgi:N-methylhydantoinase A
MRVGIDVGGTFTDLFAYDEESGETWAAKVPTTVHNQSIGVVQSIHASNIDFGQMSFLGHGTTTGLNALIERKGIKVGLLTTRGFRDVLEIMRTDRESGYDLEWSKPEPLVPRHMRLEVDGRILYDGSEEQSLDEESVRSAARELKEKGVEAVAVSLIHSYANPSHERRVAEILDEELPNVPYALSCDVNAEFREFERTNTVVVDAYIKPIMVGYIEHLVGELSDGGFDGRLLLMQGSGGMMTADRACAQPSLTISSGPAAGVIAAAKIAKHAGHENIVTFDVGGTSTDVSLIQHGIPHVSSEKYVAWGLPARVPIVDVRSVGAGGGSIGWIDQGGALKMGPQSAGSTPGPICYGNGGEEPTLSDALLLKGILGSTLADGTLQLDAQRVRSIIEERIAGPLGLTVDRVVNGMIEIAQTNMANAVRSVSIWKGLDPRDLSLVAFGGGGGMVAADVAEMLAIPVVLIPPVPGNLCAMGTLMANLQEDRVVGYLVGAAEIDIDDVNAQLATLRDDALESLVGQNVNADEVIFSYVADIRYRGQIHELRVPLGEYPLTAERVATLANTFEGMYEEVYAIRLADGEAEIVNLRVRGTSVLPHYAMSEFDGGHEDPAAIGSRDVLIGDERVPVDIYERYDLPVNTTLDGPVIVQEAGSTIWISPGMHCVVDRNGNLLIHTSGLADSVSSGATNAEKGI